MQFEHLQFAGGRRREKTGGRLDSTRLSNVACRLDAGGAFELGSARLCQRSAEYRSPRDELRTLPTVSEWSSGPDSSLGAWSIAARASHRTSRAPRSSLAQLSADLSVLVLLMEFAKRFWPTAVAAAELLVVPSSLLLTQGWSRLLHVLDSTRRDSLGSVRRSERWQACRSAVHGGAY